MTEKSEDYFKQLESVLVVKDQEIDQLNQRINGFEHQVEHLKSEIGKYQHLEKVVLSADEKDLHIDSLKRVNKHLAKMLDTHIANRITTENELKEACSQIATLENKLSDAETALYELGLETGTALRNLKESTVSNDAFAELMLKYNEATTRAVSPEAYEKILEENKLLKLYNDNQAKSLENTVKQLKASNDQNKQLKEALEMKNDEIRELREGSE